MNSVESNVTDYLVPSDTKDQFQNIVTFLTNATLKDTKILENSETDISKWLGNLLIKYCENGLSEDDVKNLMTFVKVYNLKLEETRDKISEDSDSNKDYITVSKKYYTFFNGMYKELGTYDIKKIVNWYIKKNNYDYVQITTNKYVINDDNTLKLNNNINGVEYKYFYYNNNTKNYDIITDEHYDKYYSKNDINNIYYSVEKDPTYEAATKIEADIEYYYNNANNLYTKININDNTSKTGEGTIEDEGGNIRVVHFSDYYEKIGNNYSLAKSYEIYESANLNKDIIYVKYLKYIDMYYPDILKNINLYYKENTYNEDVLKRFLRRLYFKKDVFWINVLATTESTATKLRANTSETINIQNGEPNIFFLLTLPLDNKFLSENNFIDNNALVSNSDVRSSTDSKTTVVVTILYKELNPEIRKILNSDMTEISNLESLVDPADSLSDEYTMNLLKMAASFYNLNAAMKYPRNIGTTIYAYTNNNKTLTTNLYKYLHSNAYMVRRSNESDIIAYYYGDRFISNGYGIYKYQQKEIENFLIIFKETRDYYYSVLLNYSFINDDNYSAYEKMFISYWSIERFLTNKLDNLKDIDTYDATDCANFFKSYGFSSLGDKIRIDEYKESEDYAKALIKNYVKLQQNKGNRNVIDEIETAFSVNNTVLTMYKNILCYQRDEKSETNKLVILKTKYNSSNIMSDLLSPYNSVKDLSTVIAEDNYWDITNTSTEMLSNLNVDTANTKYIIGEVSSELSNMYYTTRAAFSVIDWLSSIIDNDQSNNNIKIGEYDITLTEYCKLVRHIYKRYYTTAIIASANNPDFLFENIGVNQKIFKIKMSEGIFNKYKDYFIDPESDTNKNGYPGVNYSKIISDFGSDISDDQQTILLNIFTYITPLFIVYADFNDNNKFTNNINNMINNLKKYCAIAYSHDVTSISNTDISNIIGNISNIVKFWATGQTIMSGQETYNIINNASNHSTHGQKHELQPAIIRNVLEDIMSVILTNVSNSDNCQSSLMQDISVNEDILVSVFNVSENSTETEYKNALLEAKSTLDEIADGLISFGIGQSSSTINFLKTAIEYFISYTTELLDLNYSRSWNNTGEVYDTYDKYDISIISKYAENFYYDDALQISYEIKS